MTNNKYHVVADGFSSIRVNAYNPEQFKTSEGENERLDDFVKKQTERARRNGGSFYDGEMIGTLVDSIKTNKRELSFNAQNMRYSQHAGLFRINPFAPIQATYVNAVTLTLDDRIVLGTTQATEANWMGKLSIPAGGLTLGPDGFPSLGHQLYAELSEEVGISPEYHLIGKIIPGWIAGASAREGNYHLTTSFVVPLQMTENDLKEWFNDWKFAQQKWLVKSGRKIELKDLRFLPNDPTKLNVFLSEQDSRGENANILGKTADVIDIWANRYNCDPHKLQNLKEARVYLPQPKIF